MFAFVGHTTKIFESKRRHSGLISLNGMSQGRFLSAAEGRLVPKPRNNGISGYCGNQILKPPCLGGSQNLHKPASSAALLTAETSSIVTARFISA